jgi:uncharacterized protein YutE (UPF0331/DUF86 family)
MMAGYRNRMVHFYHEISAEEIYVICSTRLGELETMLGAYRRWVASNPEKVDPGP